MDSETAQPSSMLSKSVCRCPICGAASRKLLPHDKHELIDIFTRIHRIFYNQRICNSCNLSFATSIGSELLWKLFRPVVGMLFPHLKAPRPCNKALYTAEFIPTVARGEAKKSSKSEHRIPTQPSAIPFTVDPINRVVSLNLSCPIGSGNFADQIMAATSSLETELRLAADQIDALVRHTTANGGTQEPLPEKKDSLSEIISQLSTLTHAKDPGKKMSRAKRKRQKRLDH